MNEIGVEKFYIELLDYFPCNTREELYQREGECIRSHNSELNSKIQGRTNKEYREDNREELLTKKGTLQEEPNILQKKMNILTPSERNTLKEIEMKYVKKKNKHTTERWNRPEKERGYEAKKGRGWELQERIE